jgi:hypothetical protein
MSKEGACAVDAHNTTLTPAMESKCKIYYTFMVGVDGTAQSSLDVAKESAEHHDVIVLERAVDPAPGEHGGNSLLTPKVRYMFGYAQKKFPWATHLAKMDIDTHPILNLALETIMHAKDDVNTKQQIEEKAVRGDWSEVNGGIYYGITMAGPRGFQQGTVLGFCQQFRTRARE